MKGERTLPLAAEALDDRVNDEADFEVIPELSCTNTNFGGPDPAMVDKL